MFGTSRTTLKQGMHTALDTINYARYEVDSGVFRWERTPRHGALTMLDARQRANSLESPLRQSAFDRALYHREHNKHARQEEIKQAP